MRRSHALKLVAAFLVAFALYVGTFSYWWLSAPSKIVNWRGQRVRFVDFQFNTFSWHTEIMWLPAFWFVEHVCGYEPGGFAAMHEQSVQVFQDVALIHTLHSSLCILHFPHPRRQLNPKMTSLPNP